MAYMSSEGSKKFYNVEQAVGPNAPNAQGDVKLVQYCLRHIYGNAASGLAIDGWIGPVTNSWIKKFQTEVKAKGHSILVDGRVDRALSNEASSVSKTRYCIQYLNGALIQKNPAAHANLAQYVPMNPNPSPNPYTPQSTPVAGGIN